MESLSKNRVLAVGIPHAKNAFDFIRFFAAFGVLFSHSFPLTGRHEPAPGGITIGTLSVIIFFAISGYLVKQSWDRARSAFAFAFNRGLRIFPGLFVCLSICAFVLAPAVSTVPWLDYFSNSEPFRFVLSNLVMFFQPLNPPLPGTFESVPLAKIVNGSLWTVRYEIFMYVVLVFLCVVSKHSTKAILLALLACLGAWVAIKYAGVPEAIFWRINTIGLDGMSLLRMAPPFFVGALIASASHSFLKPRFAAVAVVLTILCSQTSFFLLAVWFALPYAVLTFAYCGPKCLNNFGHYGDFSYGFYIYAWPVQQTLSYLKVDTWWIHLTMGFALTLALAVLSWNLVESPALRLKKRLLAVPFASRPFPAN